MASPSGNIKQRTVNGRTVTLHQLKNQFKEINSGPYMYETRLDGSPVGDPVFTKSKGMDEFEATIRGIEKEQERQQEPRQGGGFGGFGGFGGGYGGGGGGGGLFGNGPF